MANLPISDFLKARLEEFDPNFELRKGTGFEKLFFQPMQFMIQPLRDEADEMQTAQSLRRILQTEDPDSFNEEAVDDVISNVYVDRRQGGVSSGVAYAYYDEPVDREFAVGAAVFVGNNGKNYVNTSTFSITRSQMSAQISNGRYYFSIPVSSEDSGEDTELDVGGLISLLDDPDVASVTNLTKISGGLSREKNTEYIDRSKNSIAVRDLVTGKGFNGILYENFPGLISELRPIGFGDKEMMRDIVFNTHIGGKVDGYVKTPNIQEGSSDFIGLLVDTTRQTRTSTNVELIGTAYSNLSNTDLDRTGGKDPIVRQVKAESSAQFLSNIDISSPIDLTSGDRIKMIIDGVSKEFRIAGVNITATNRNEIVALINAAFEIDVAIPFGNSFKVISPTTGLDSSIIITDPDIGNSALSLAFDSSESPPLEFYGDGPITFLEGIHYNIVDQDGLIRRVIGADISASSEGEGTSGSDIFSDSGLNVFSGVAVNDILSIESGTFEGDYRILEVIDNNNIRVDFTFTDNFDTTPFTIRRTGIKDGEVVFTEYYFNPLSIDVGNQVKLEGTRERGIRPGREDFTITDLAFLRIRSIEIIDPLTREPTGEVLEGRSGYGIGGYGRGPYGIGSGNDYRLVVNSPHERFSAFEDSYIVLSSGLAGLSVRVNYDYVPEIVEFHNFVLSETERNLDGDILMKHFIPCVVEGTIEYSVDETDISIPTNESLQTDLRKFISNVKSDNPLQFSDIKQFIARKTDPFDRYGSFIRNFTLTAKILNPDGSVTVIEGTESLEFPELDPFPLNTDRPQSGRISGWIAREGLVLSRI